MISDFDKGFVKWIEDNIMSLTPYQIALLLSFTCDDEELMQNLYKLYTDMADWYYG